METWIELINGPIWSEILQINQLFQKIIESILFLFLCYSHPFLCNGSASNDGLCIS